MYGLSDDEIAAIREGHFVGFAPPEMTRCGWRTQWPITPSNASDELYAKLGQHFWEEQIIELVASDGLYRKKLQFKRRAA